jgi:hypothetical protein
VRAEKDARLNMQLASQREIPDQEISPLIRAALVDSLFETAATLLAGIVFAVFAATLTALKTGEYPIWACVGLLVATGAVRMVDLQRYHARKSTLTVDEAAHWKKRFQIRAMIQPAAIGIWCATTLLSTDDAVAHMICLSVTTGLAAGGAGRA